MEFSLKTYTWMGLHILVFIGLAALSGCSESTTKEADSLPSQYAGDSFNPSDSMEPQDLGTERPESAWKAPAHPFMYLSGDRRDFILENIQSEPMASIYAKLNEKAMAELKPIDTADWNAKDHGKNGEIAAANAFLAWLNEDQEASERALAAIDLLESNWKDHSGWGINIRMPDSLIHYTAAWDFLKATPYFTNEQARELEEKLSTITREFYNKYLLDESIRNLSLTVAQNNHPIRTAAAIGFVALAFQDDPDSKTWLDWAVSELEYLMGPKGQYVQEDGAISEGPFYFNYGFAATIPFYIALENRESPERIYNRNCINRSNEDPWTGHGCVDGEEFTFLNPMRSARFHDILDWSLSLRLPNGNRAPIADSPLRNQSAQAIFTHFGGPDYLYWDWESNPSDPYKIKGGFELGISHLAYVTPQTGTEAPTWKNRFFIDGGMATFRSGWNEEDLVLVLMGENGAARKTLHDHSDGTHFVLAAYGDLLITDTGYYKPSSLQNAVTSAAGAHNLILIEGESVAPKGLLNDWGDADAFIENTVEGEKLAYAESRQDYPDTEVIRGLSFIRERYFIIADTLESDHEEARSHQFRLHAFAGIDLSGSVTLDEHGPHIQKEKGALQVYTASSVGACALTEPEFKEKSLPHVHKLESDEGHHTVTDCSISGHAPDFLTILAPYKLGSESGDTAPLSVTPIPTEKGVAWQISGEGFVDLAWLRDEGAPEELVLPDGKTIQSDGRYIFLSLDQSLALLSRGRELKINNVKLISSEDTEPIKVLNEGARR